MCPMMLAPVSLWVHFCSNLCSLEHLMCSNTRMPYKFLWYSLLILSLNTRGCFFNFSFVFLRLLETFDVLAWKDRVPRYNTAPGAHLLRQPVCFLWLYTQYALPKITKMFSFSLLMLLQLFMVTAMLGTQVLYHHVPHTFFLVVF